MACKTLNNLQSSKYHVHFDSKVCKDPKSRVKQINAISAQKITNIVDVESKNSDALQRFEKTLKNMKDAEKLGKPIKFDLAYSNFSFELWLLLHKIDCNQSLSCIDNYLGLINKTFNREFESLRQFKRKENCENVMEQLSIDDVKNAVIRAKKLQFKKSEDGLIPKKYGKYSYFCDNPATSVWVIVDEILKTCGV